MKSETTARALDAFCPPRQAWLLTVFLLFYYTVQLKGCRLSQHNIFDQQCRVELSVNVRCKWAPLVEFRRMGWRYLKRFTLRQIVSYRYFCRRSSGRTLKILNTLIWFWQVNAAIEFLKNSKPQTNYHHWLRHNNLMPHWLSTRKTTTPGGPLYHDLNRCSTGVGVLDLNMCFRALAFSEAKLSSLFSSSGIVSSLLNLVAFLVIEILSLDLSCSNTCFGYCPLCASDNDWALLLLFWMLFLHQSGLFLRLFLGCTAFPHLL